MTRETSVQGVYVAGDAGSPLQQIVSAAASGASAAAFLNHGLSDEDAEAEISSTRNGDALSLAAAGTVGEEAV